MMRRRKKRSELSRQTGGVGMTTWRAERQAGLDMPSGARRVRRGDARDYLAFLQRVLRAYGGRVVEGDVEDLAQLISLRCEVDRLIAETVVALRRQPYGLTWTQIAAATGTTRQAVQQRYGRASEAAGTEGS
jgi:DNA-directed RNA polymerase specialized sigma24 family protein